MRASLALEFWSTLAFVFLAFVGPHGANCFDQAQIEAIDKLIIEQFQPVNSIPGVGLAVVHGNSTLARGYGYRDLEQGLQVTSGTFFIIGSVSKSFTALVVLRVLITTFPDHGESVLDVPIRELVPTYNFTLIDRYRSENLNMRDLLSHHACTKPQSYWGLFSAPYKDSAEFVYRQRYSQSACLARSDFVYNNGLVQTAGEIAAHIAGAGTSFEDLLLELLRDLGMTSTTIINEAEDYEAMPLMARPYYRQDGVLKRFNSELLKQVATRPGSGGILTTPTELVKYLQFHLDGGRVGGTQIIPEYVLKWMYKVVTPFPDGLQFKTGDDDADGIIGNLGYGLCLYVGVHHGFQTLSHRGSVAPYLTMMTMVPAHHIGILVTVNGPGDVLNMTVNSLNTEIVNILLYGSAAASERKSVDADRKLGQPEMGKMPAYKQKRQNAKERNARMQVQNRKRDVARSMPYDLAGKYGNPTLGEFNVTRHNDTVSYLRYGRYAHAWLVQRAPGGLIYDPVWDSDFPQFFLAETGSLPPVSFDFTDPLVAYFDVDGVSEPFYKDTSLDTLPVQPWEPGTCSLVN